MEASWGTHEAVGYTLAMEAKEKWLALGTWAGKKKNDLCWIQKQQRNARATKGAVGSPKDSVSLRSKGDKKQDLVF